MITGEVILARKYVAAYVNVYGDNWTSDSVCNLMQYSNFFHEQRTVTAYLKLTCIASVTKKQLLMASLTEYHLEKLLDPLVSVLIRHKRLELLGETLHALSNALALKCGVEEITIRTASPLTTQQWTTLQEEIARILHKMVYAIQVVDPRLIAGVRIEGRSFLWEQSIRQQLRHIAIVS